MNGEGSGPEAASRPHVWPAVLAAYLVWVIAIAVNAPLKLDHDVSYFLASGRILNQGARLYVDWIDFNTTAPSGLGRWSAWLASQLHAPLDVTHKGTIFALAAAGLGVALAAMAPLLRRRGPVRWILAVGLAAVLLLSTPEIGGREHLMCIGIAGWVISLLLASANMQRPWQVAVAAGIAAGLAIYLKPHFMLFAVALGLVDLVRARGRPDKLLLSTWITAGVSIALYAWLVLANPDFLRVMLPATVDLYASLEKGWLAPVSRLAGRSVEVIALAAAAFALAHHATTHLPRTVLAVAVLVPAVALIIYIQQGYGFTYQRLPFDISLHCIAVGLLAWATHDRRIGFGNLVRLAGAVIAGLALLGHLGYAMESILRYPRREVVANSSFVAALRPPHAGSAVLVIGTDIPIASEALTYIDARWSGDFVSYFPIAALIRQGGRDALLHPLSEEKRARWTPWFRQKVAEPFCRDLPVRVAVDISAQPTFFQRPGFDMLAWLREDPDFDGCWRAAGLKPKGAPIPIQVQGDQHIYQVYAPD